jgi:hypothetical protein
MSHHSFECATVSGLGAMTRRHCPKCGDGEALFAGTKCCSCGGDIAAKPKRGRGRPRGITINGPRARTAPLRTPIAESPEALLALMAAKP